MKDEKRRELEAWRKENGFCTQCGDKLSDGYAFITCEKCRANCRARYEARKENRLCIMCGNKLPDGYTSVTCEDCKNYQREPIEQESKSDTGFTEFLAKMIQNSVNGGNKHD